MYGFVYIWYDRKHKRYYIGSHKGSIDDGYICSSSWMKNAYKRRPNDFKRRILSFVSSNRKDLLNEEQKWLDQIKESELSNRYYNLKKSANGGFSKKAHEKRRAQLLGSSPSKEHRKKLSDALIGIPWSQKRRNSQKGNYKKRLTYFHKGVIIGTIDEAAIYANVNKSTIRRWTDKDGRYYKSEWRKEYVD